MTSFTRSQQDRKARQERARKRERKLMHKMGGRQSEGWKDRKRIVKQQVVEREIQQQDAALERKQNATA